MSPAAAPLVSVVLATRNRAALLPRAIHSVLGQSYRQLELWVVDDASTDDTAAIVGAIDDARLHLLRLPRSVGTAAARNVALARARGTLLAFQDDDDCWFVQKLEKQVAHLLASPADAGLSLCGRLRQWDAHVDYVGGERWLRQLQFQRGNLPELDYSLIATPGWLLRREQLDAVGGFDESLRRWNDWELAYRLSRRCRFVHLPEPLYLQERRRLAGGGLWDNQALSAQALQHIVDKHGSDWSAADRARHYHLLGRYAAIAGAPLAARRWFALAVRTHPAGLRSGLGLALTVLGPRLLRASIHGAGAVKGRLLALARR